MQVEVTVSRLDIGTIVLEESVQSLSEAVISSKQEAKKSSVEHTTINADANISGAKGSVLDILRTASSVSIASDKSITVRGKSNILVLIDGVPTTVTDLESIPVANVKSVDVITNPDARYDSEGTGGIINIVSKKQNASGLSGMVGANYGFNHFANGNFAIVSNTPKVSWRLNEKRVTLTFCVFIQQKPCLPPSQNQLETGRSDIIPCQRCQYLHPRLAYLTGQ